MTATLFLGYLVLIAGMVVIVAFRFLARRTAWRIAIGLLGWLLYVGVIAIVVGVSYFEKLAIDSHWVGETARTVQGGILGLLLVYAGLRFVRAGYAIY